MGTSTFMSLSGWWRGQKTRYSNKVLIIWSSEFFFSPESSRTRTWRTRSGKLSVFLTRRETGSSARQSWRRCGLSWSSDSYIFNYFDWPYQWVVPKRKMTCSQLKILPRWHFLLSVSHSPFRCWQIWTSSWINQRPIISGDANHWRGTLSTGDRGGKINSKIDEEKLPITH